MREKNRVEMTHPNLIGMARKRLGFGGPKTQNMQRFTSRSCGVLFRREFSDETHFSKSAHFFRVIANFFAVKVGFEPHTAIRF